MFLLFSDIFWVNQKGNWEQMGSTNLLTMISFILIFPFALLFLSANIVNI